MLNQQLLAVTSAVLTIAPAKTFLSRWSPGCLDAVERRLPEAAITQACGVLDNGDLVLIILAVCAGAAALFAREIADLVHNAYKSSQEHK